MTSTSRPVALVTGGSRGIGRAIVRELHSQGFRVGFTYLKDATVARALADELDPQDVVPLQADVRDGEACARTLEALLASLGSLEALVNNAGVTKDGPLYSMDPEEWHDVLDCNLSGAFRMCRAVVPHFLRKVKGSIVNISSVAGVMGVKGQANYCASKAGLLGFTRALALECAPRRIRVNAVAPGFIRSDMTEALTEQQRKDALGKVPLGRFGEGEDVARLTHFLLSEAADYITGQVFVVDGGLTA